MSKSKNHSIYYNNCSELPLKIFCEIINSRKFNLLRKDEKNDKYCIELWAEIMLEYGEIDDNYSVQNNFGKQTQLTSLQNSFVTLKAMIRFLWYVSPSNKKYGAKASNIIDDFKKMGYSIDQSNSQKYAESLLLVDRRINALNTRIKMLENELASKDEEEGISFDQLMAMLSMEFSYLKEDISVKRYVECKKIIKKKNASNK